MIAVIPGILLEGVFDRKGVTWDPVALTDASRHSAVLDPGLCLSHEITSFRKVPGMTAGLGW
jgi:hypothetical protein